MSALWTIVLLFISNVFMTLAWYAHLKLKQFDWFNSWPLFVVIVFSWGIAFFEYCFQVPANRIGFEENDGPYSLVQLKVIQEVITLLVFTVFTALFFREQALRWNHLAGFVCMIGAIYFVFLKS
jgi:hypothetical protein